MAEENKPKIVGGKQKPLEECPPPSEVEYEFKEVYEPACDRVC